MHKDWLNAYRANQPEVKSYPNKHNMVIDEEGNLVLQPATPDRSTFLLVLLLTLVTNVPQSFKQFLYTVSFIVFSLLCFIMTWQEYFVKLNYTFVLHLVLDVALLWSPHRLSYHLVCCWSPSATETPVPDSSLDARRTAWMTPCKYKEQVTIMIITYMYA